MSSNNNQRIAKNTLLLYLRMLLLMTVSLYTSRVVLDALGVEDYGIYNVVGGVVVMFSVISGSLSAAISRFITYELGVGNIERLKKVFSSSLIIQLFIAAIVVLIAETFGLWFLHSKMVIPEDRITAADWVYQFSIVTFVLNLISVPYNSLIIAHEKMSAFAYISVLEGIGKFVIALSIIYSPIDRLIYYALLLASLAILIRLIYGWYCKKNFEEASFHWYIDKVLLREMFGFAGWNFIGSAACVLRDQGGNVIINLFCGPSVNAARGIAVQVNTAVSGFVQNFMTALNPQITKSYACGNREYMMRLIFQGARLSYYMLLVLSMPILFNTPYILDLWLKNVPDYTACFIQLSLILTMNESLANPLITAMLATGKIRKYQIIAGGINLLNLPVSYTFLRLGATPEYVFIIAIIFSVIVQGARLFLLRDMIKLSIKGYLVNVYSNVGFVTLLSIVLPFIVSTSGDQTFVSFLASVFVTMLWTILIILFVGCKKEERNFVLKKVKAIILRK